MTKTPLPCRISLIPASFVERGTPLTTLTLSDLRYAFYGGNSRAEYDFLTAAAAAGVSASSLLNTSEIDYKENTSNVATPAGTGGAGNSYTLIPGSAIVVPVQIKPYSVTWGGFLLASLAATAMQLSLFKDGAYYRGLQAPITGAVNGTAIFSRTIRLPISVTGTFDIRVGVNNNIAGSVVTAFGTIEPTFLRINKS